FSATSWTFRNIAISIIPPWCGGAIFRSPCPLADRVRLLLKRSGNSSNGSSTRDTHDGWRIWARRESWYWPAILIRNANVNYCNRWRAVRLWKRHWPRSRGRDLPRELMRELPETTGGQRHERQGLSGGRWSGRSRPTHREIVSVARERHCRAARRS